MGNTTGPQTRDGMPSPALKRMRRMTLDELKAYRRELNRQIDRLEKRVNALRRDNPRSTRVDRCAEEKQHLQYLLSHASELVRTQKREWRKKNEARRGRMSTT